MCKFYINNLIFVYENRPDGEGETRAVEQQKYGAFHALSDSEVNTVKFSCTTNSCDIEHGFFRHGPLINRSHKDCPCFKRFPLPRLFAHQPPFFLWHAVAVK